VTDAFRFDRATVFGWTLHRKQLAAGEFFMVKVSEDTLPEEADNISLWTKGEIAGQSFDGTRKLESRLPGRFSLDYTAPLREGAYIFTAKSDSEWWCINYLINKKRLPKVTPFRLAAGEVAQLMPGTKLMLCSGELQTFKTTLLETPMEISVTEQIGVLALSQVYGLYFHDTP
jgi:hypothetical protein